MDIIRIVITSASALAALFALTKLLGKRQMSQLTLFDYITGITIGNATAEMATSAYDEMIYPLTAMVVFTLISFCISIANDKSLRFRRFVLGKPLVLYDSGTLYYRNLKKARLDMTEFLTECRANGYFDLTQLGMVTLEVNGKLSILPLESARPLTPKDMSISPPRARPPIAVVLDGALREDALRASGNDVSWLMKQLGLQGYKDISNVLLAAVDKDNNLSVFERNEEKPDGSYYS